MYKKKIKILRIIGTLDPKYGGPSRAIIDNSMSLQKQGFDIDILTSDKKNSNYFKSKIIKVHNLGPGIGNYCFNLKLFFWLIKNRHNYDKFLIHGLWQFNTLVARLLLKKKYYVFSHGQLDPYFGSEKLKKIKKKIYWFFFEKENLLQANLLLLTSQKEKKSLQNTYLNTIGIKKKTVDYGISKPEFNAKKGIQLFNKKFKKIKNKNFLIYLGRFHKKKGCDILLKSIKKIIDKKYQVYLLLAGSNNNYKDYLVKLSEKLNLNNYVIWSDFLLDDLKWFTLSKSDAMVLASHGENFGVSLVEAMSLKKPTITTNKVNIYDKINSTSSGIITDDNVSSFTTGLIKFLNLSNKNKKKMGDKAFECYNNYFNVIKLNNKLISILKK